MSTTTDDRDARYALRHASDEAAAEEIRQRHVEMIREREGAVESTRQVCEKAFQIATLVESVHARMGGRRFADWWRDQALPVGWAEKYLRLSRTAQRSALADKDQLRLIGVLPSPEGTTQGQSARASNPFAWIKWTAKIRKSFSDDSIKVMDDADRAAALSHLQPIKELIAKLEGHPSKGIS